MPAHGRIRAASTQHADVPSLANCLVPFLIFSFAMFVVYQVNHHRQLEGMIASHEELNKEHHFVTGGRKSQEGGIPAQADTGFPDKDTMQQPLTIGRNSHNSDGHSIGSIGRTDSTKSSDAIDANHIHDVTMGKGTAGSTTQQIKSNEAHNHNWIDGSCHMELHSEYPGDVVQWGADHIVEDEAACCAACQKRASDGCNVWVFCAADKCGAERVHGECWLKKARLDDILMNHQGQGHASVPWSSGVLYSPEEFAAYQKRADAAAAAEKERLAKLKAREDLSLVWMDVSIKGLPAGRMEFVLFDDLSPLAAENLRRMCTGEVSPQHTLKGAPFYRIIDRFIDQTGVDVSPPAIGGMFKDDPAGLELKHDRKGLLSVANAGHNTNTGHFSILMGPAPHLNGNYVIFGELVSGWEVAEAVNALSRGRPKNELLHSRDAIITDVGQIRRGKPIHEDILKAGLVS